MPKVKSWYPFPQLSTTCNTEHDKWDLRLKFQDNGTERVTSVNKRPAVISHLYVNKTDDYIIRIWIPSPQYNINIGYLLEYIRRSREMRTY